MLSPPASNIASLGLYASRRLRADIPILAVALVSALYVLVTSEDHTFTAALAVIVIVLSALLSFLFTFWSVSWKAFIQCCKVYSVEDAEYVKVIAAPHRGASALCKLEHDDRPDKERNYWFIFQRRKFVYDRTAKQFQKLAFPSTGFTFETYLSSRGYTSEEEVAQARARYGANRFDIPMPTFGELYREHAVAPFFVFQVFCMLLWCLDEYWYYSVFTLGMLLLFEAFVVRSRLKNLQLLRAMVVPPRPIAVYRMGAWRTVSTVDLLPGDLVAIGRAQRRSAADDGGVVVPCDILLLSGTAIVNEAMLTGESVPLMKEGIRGRQLVDMLDIKKDKLHVLFGGTKIVMHSAASGPSAPERKPLTAPEGACVGYVLRTGFDTAQGKLMRTILFATERMTANTRESLLFILFLLVFAIAASGYVLATGLGDPERSRWKLLLKCVLIITSVVPPELPMELSLAVNNSLIALHKQSIFCTEPFRIPLAGKIDVCCFDKTGTLTADDLVFRGVDTGDTDELRAPTALPDDVTFGLAGCHSLVHIDGKIVGDPMEKAAFSAMRWAVSRSSAGDVCVDRFSDRKVRILHRHHFDSALKRMGAVIAVDAGRSGADEPQPMAVCKGAPEVLRGLFTPDSLPADYDMRYKRLSRRGYRVVAIGTKPLPQAITAAAARDMPRHQVESGLRFGGFLAFDCPLKDGSASTIAELTAASHRVVMVTGDNVLTALKVAHDLKILTRPVDGALILTLHSTDDTGGGRLSWVSADETVRLPLAAEPAALAALAATHDLCLPGDALAYLLQHHPHPSLPTIVPHVAVFARMSPDQKESVVLSLKAAGYVTLMCGDGCNDVGALKQADVGVALIDAAGELPLPLRPRVPKDPASEPDKSGPATRRRPPPKGSRGPQESTAARPSLSAKLNAAMADTNDEDGPPVVQLGDASIAAPFTARAPSIKPIINVVLQGRCTLVTTLQMYKILALNCLVSAYTLSALALDGVKLGDTQATVIGVLIAMCFLFISRSKPLPVLSKQRPPPRLFTPALFFSLIGQFAIHLACLIFVVSRTDHYITDAGLPRAKADDEFKPNVLNTIVFLISATMQLATFAVNYKGHPFMQGIRENTGLLYCMIITGAITLVSATEILPVFNESFELVPLPIELRAVVLGAMVVDLVGTWVWEMLTKLLFSTPTVAY